jgi:membrane protein YdbS with pleckstrin-like domain
VDPRGLVVVVTLWTLAILPRQARAYGYQLREDDLVFRRGILWQRMVAVPYGRMQLVDITHGPLDRGFGIAQLKLVTAAAATGVTIPGSASRRRAAARHPHRRRRDPPDGL